MKSEKVWMSLLFTFSLVLFTFANAAELVDLDPVERYYDMSGGGVRSFPIDNVRTVDVRHENGFTCEAILIEANMNREKMEGVVHEVYEIRRDYDASRSPAKDEAAVRALPGRHATISFDAYGLPVIGVDDGDDAGLDVWGKERLTDIWWVTPHAPSKHHFFRVTEAK